MPMSPNIDDRPTCSKCNVEMLRGIAEPIVPGYELRNFECPSCGNKLKLVGCACRKSNPAILVMQSAEDWAAKNTPCPLNSTR